MGVSKECAARSHGVSNANTSCGLYVKAAGQERAHSESDAGSISSIAESEERARAHSLSGSEGTAKRPVTDGSGELVGTATETCEVPVPPTTASQTGDNCASGPTEVSTDKPEPCESFPRHESERERARSMCSLDSPEPGLGPCALVEDVKLRERAHSAPNVASRGIMETYRTHSLSEATGSPVRETSPPPPAIRGQCAACADETLCATEGVLESQVVRLCGYSVGDSATEGADADGLHVPVHDCVLISPPAPTPAPPEQRGRRAPLPLPDEANYSSLPGSSSPRIYATPCIPEEDENGDADSGEYSLVLGEDQLYVTVTSDRWEGSEYCSVKWSPVTPIARPHRPPVEVVMIREVSFPLETKNEPEEMQSAQSDSRSSMTCFQYLLGKNSGQQRSTSSGLRSLLVIFLLFTVLLVIIVYQAINLAINK